MKINKSKLQAALQIVKPALASQEVIEQSSSFAFLGDRVVTFNDSISLSHPVEDLDLKGAIRAEELYSLLSKLKQEEVEIVQTDDEIKLKSGRSKAGIRLQSEIKLPLEEIGEITGWEDLPEDFNDNIDFVKDSASSDMARRMLTCVNIEENYLIASDGLQLMRLRLNPETPFPFPDVLIPSENVREIVKVEPELVAVTEGWLHFKNFNGTVLSLRVMVDEYPETDRHFEASGHAVTFPKEMPEILDKAMVFTKRDELMDEEMQILIKGSKLMVKGKNEYGWFEEKAPVKYEGKKASFWISPHLLKNILSRSSTCILGEEKIKFEGENWEYVAILRDKGE